MVVDHLLEIVIEQEVEKFTGAYQFVRNETRRSPLPSTKACGYVTGDADQYSQRARIQFGCDRAEAWAGSQWIKWHR